MKQKNGIDYNRIVWELPHEHFLQFCKCYGVRVTGNNSTDQRALLEAMYKHAFRGALTPPPTGEERKQAKRTEKRIAQLRAQADAMEQASYQSLRKTDIQQTQVNTPPPAAPPVEPVTQNEPVQMKPDGNEWNPFLDGDDDE